MTTQSENTKRIAKNTILLYVRMLFGMLVSLYTSRVIISALGVVDYGIYGVVGSFVAMFSLINGSLSASASRFLTFELGRGDMNKLKTVFSTSLLIHIALAVVVVLLLETVGLWFLNNKMVIPADRMFAANCVYQASVLSFVLGLLSVPYNASIVAHERMKAFAYIGILDILLRLGVVILVAHLPAACDRLIYYALLILALAFMMQYLYWRYCRKNFEECHLQFTFDKSCWKQMGSFAGWNFIGSSSAVLREQGGNILINLLGGGPAVNAARGIAASVQSAVASFVANFMTAVNPQITKSYASGEHEYMMSLIFRSARFSYFLLLMLALPILLNTHYILNLWLDIVPAHSVLFTQLVLIFAMCESISNPLVTVMLATGNIRNYQIVVGGLQSMNFPLSFIMLRLGYFPEIVMVVAIFLSLCCLVTRIYMLRGMVGLSARGYFKEVILRILCVTFAAIVLPLLVVYDRDTDFTIFIISSIICVVSSGLSIYYLGCKISERTFIRERFFIMLGKIGIKNCRYDKNSR